MASLLGVGEHLALPLPLYLYPVSEMPGWDSHTTAIL